jgi:hypothetical protein
MVPLEELIRLWGLKVLLQMSAGVVADHHTASIFNPSNVFLISIEAQVIYH